MSNPHLRHAGLSSLRRLPLTIGMVLMLVVVGLLVESHAGPLATPIRRAFGSSLQTLLDGDVSRVVTSLFLTAGGCVFLLP